jgi:Tfp pilus assembly protein PilP
LLRNKYITILVALVLSASLSFAAEIKKGPQTQKEETKFDIGDFEYKSEGRRDPFEPVLLNKEKAKRDIRVSPKDRKTFENKMGYELEELKLVGVLKSDKGMMAMMENAKGEGIFYKKGDPLNNQIGMWVADITNTNVVFAYKLKGEIKKVVVDLPTKK